MTSRILRRLGSYLCLDYRIPIYEERAEGYRQMALKKSVIDGIRIDPMQDCGAIDVTALTALALPGKQRIEFMRGENGLYFARIEGGKCYPINIEQSEEWLKKARHYEKLADSFWRRLLAEAFEFTRFDPILYRLDQVAFDLDRLSFGLEGLLHSLQSFEHSLQSFEERNKRCDSRDSNPGHRLGKAIY